ncbi:MAG: hypothetical protein WCE62_04540 [Polyangiales bacterium]
MRPGSRIYTFFSVHERLFLPVHRVLRDRYGVEAFAGTVWGQDQATFLAEGGIDYDPLLIFTRDVLDEASSAVPDLAFLRDRENRYGVPMHRMIWSERHLLEGRSYEQVLSLTERLFRVVEDAFERFEPSFLFSEDVGCLTSYVHYAVARGRGIPFWRIGSARMPGLLSVYSGAPQEWNLTKDALALIRKHGLTAEQRTEAHAFVRGFRDRPEQPTGMRTRARLPIADKEDVERLLQLGKRYMIDSRNPTLISPMRALRQRALRLSRNRISRSFDYFDRPVTGERYVLYPVHFQPEASTLVQAPYYLDQAALIADISKSLPVGCQLYVKEHVSNRGRRPLDFYRQVRETFGVRLLGPDENTWTLIRDAAAVAVITGTVGWEALLFGKAVVTFGDVFYNECTLTHRAGLLPKDRWHEIFHAAVTEHQHDEERLLEFVAAIRASSRPGFLKNPNTFPAVLEPDNVERIADALAWGAGLRRVDQ